METHPIGNTEVDWGKFDPAKYMAYHYSTIHPADSYTANRIIHTLRQLTHGRASLVEIGNGGGLRIACIPSPLLSPDAVVRLTDVGYPQLNRAHEQVQRTRNNLPVDWTKHEADMVKGNAGVDGGRPNPEWAGALARVCLDPLIERHDITTTPLGPAAIRIEGHTLCSLSQNEADYEQACANFYDGMETGDIAVRIFDIDSDGYFVDGVWFPGYPVTPRNVQEQAEQLGLGVLDVFSVPFDTALPGPTLSTFCSIGGAVLLKP